MSKWNIRAFLAAVCVVLVLGVGSGRAAVWEPGSGHTQIAIWPHGAPDSRSLGGDEYVETVRNPLIAGRPFVEVGRVSRPTITVYVPKVRNTGTAMVVFPGGAYEVLGIDFEGTETCDWLTTIGITCVVLKYRVPGETGTSKAAVPPVSPADEKRWALEDAQRALGLIRLHAAQWNIDPHKIGVLGYSAGGHLAAALSTHFQRRLYKTVDAADLENCRPDFVVGIYPAYLAVGINRFGLTPDIRDHMSSRVPPTFLLQAEDDHSASVEDSLSYYAALKKAGVPVEMHLYSQGGHAFGLRRTKLPITRWPQLVQTWLGTIGMI